MSAAAQKVYAYLSWMSSTNQAKKPNGSHMVKLQQLLGELATMVCIASAAQIGAGHDLMTCS